MMNIFNFIKQKISILDVISHYSTLKKAGGYWKGHCPFHNEKTASFTVSPHKDIFYCFGCHSGGDVITFISRIEHCDVIQAVYFLAERYHITIPQELLSSTSSEKQYEEKKHYWQLCQLITDWCHKTLQEHTSALDYLKLRGVTDESIKKFKLGYFPSGQLSIKKLIQELTKNSYLLNDVLHSGVIQESKHICYSPFEDRIIFPIFDHLGRACGFGGRIFKEQDTRAKYYNSKENDFFIKSSLLFGFDKARQDIQKTNTVFLVEGYLDCIVMHQVGLQNTVATLGTACSLEHLKQLARFADQLFVVYDGDVAGQNAMLRLTELCWQVSMELKIINLPNNEDPASFITKKGDFQSLINAAQDIFSFFIESSTQDFFNKTLNEKVNIARKIITIIQRVNDPLKQDILLQRTAKACDIPLASLKQEIMRNSQKSHKIAENALVSPPDVDQNITIDANLKEISELEKKLFSVIINNVHLLKAEDEEYIFESFSIPLRDVLKKLKLIQGDQGSIDFTHFFSTLDKQEKQIVSNILLTFHEYDDYESYEQLLAQFQKKSWKRFIRNITVKIEQANREGNEQEIQKIMTQFHTFKQKLVTKGLI